MSSKAITAATNHFLQFRLQYASLALIYYDFALTLPREVRYVWQERFRLSTALYLGCRYALVANVLYLLAIAGKLGSTCDSWYKIVGALSILGRAAVIAVFTLRTYAVYGLNKWILGYMSILGLACVALDIVRRLISTELYMLTATGRHTFPACAAWVHPACQSPQLLSILMVVFEASSAFLTAGRCITAFRAGGLENQRQGIFFKLFEQAIFTTAAVILNYPGFLQRLPNAFTLPLSCLLTARFILYLREWDAEQLGNTNARTADHTVSDLSDLNLRGAGSTIAGVLAVEDFGADPMEVSPDTRRNSDLDLEANGVRLRKIEAGLARLGGALVAAGGRWGGSDSSVERGNGHGMV
ncbi:hypothetical protein C8R46DRAFT_1184367 [Mycena filopes]|nr:hypothetical protein C8R46DRAFT_1184367 [Mycena filopes]